MLHFTSFVLSPLPLRQLTSLHTTASKCKSAFGPSSASRRRNRVAAPVCCTTARTRQASLLQKIATIAGEERGIFGMEDSDRETLDAAIRALEAENPTTPATADNAAAAAGRWRLLYTNLEILGRKRVKLAIATSSKPGLVKLGGLYQIVRPSESHSDSVVEFSVRGGVSGTFTVRASYSVASDCRVHVEMTDTELVPEQLMKLLGKNVRLLTQIFNPTGFLDVTYVDDNLRIGRDHKDRVFVLEKAAEPFEV